MICSCCGYEIKDQPHPVENGKKYVCDKCWNNPDLFFPEKLQIDDRLKLLSEIAEESRNQSDSIQVNVIKLCQKNIEMYIGKMKSKDILQLYEIDKFKEEELDGYQRELYEERTAELVEYLTKCPIAIMPSLLVSVREAKFIPKGHDFGVLEISKKKGSIWIIDGQHRVGGFEKVREHFIFAQNPHIDPKLFKILMDYELPVVFIDAQKTIERIHSIAIGQTISPEDIERATFFIVNKTQKGINPSLKDALLYRIKIGGIEGIPALKKESWRIHAAYIGISLNQETDSSLRGKINISGRKGLGKPIQLNSFISSLKPLFMDKEFSKLSDQERLKFVKSFWNALKEIFPEAFDNKTWKRQMMLKAIGVYCLNWLACDIFRMCLEHGACYNNEEMVKKFIEPLRAFDWENRTSPLSSLAGMKGVRMGYELLRNILYAKEKNEAQDHNP